jgi:hypothetical protein
MNKDLNMVFAEVVDSLKSLEKFIDNNGIKQEMIREIIIVWKE